MDTQESPEFDEFYRSIEPRVRAVLCACYGANDGRDAAAEALGYAWECWPKVRDLEHPVAYLVRVGQSRTRRIRRRTPLLAGRRADVDPQEVDVELRRGLMSLSTEQRIAVVLAHGYGWTLSEIAEARSVTKGTAQKHLERGLRNLRGRIGAEEHGAESTNR